MHVGFVFLLCIGCASAFRGAVSHLVQIKLRHLNEKPGFEADHRGKDRKSAPVKSKHFETAGTRLNKCVIGLSRRAADEAIAAGQVSVNHAIAQCGTKVNHGDIVRFNGRVQNWQGIAIAKQQQPSLERENRKFIYLKYWKPPGVTCTSDPGDASNIIAAGKFNLLPQRLFTVGRLDKESTGLILLTSDGRVNNALLNQKKHQSKTYLVEMDRVPSDDQIAHLASGVVITTPIQRDSHNTEGSRRTTRTTDVTARSLPCRVKRVSVYNGRNYGGKLLEFTLIEGRNRQIRRMAEAVGLSVIDLHRTSFAGVTLQGLTAGQWEELDEREMEIIQRAIAHKSIERKE